MKKTILKKLVLNKTTVTDLKSNEMTHIKGGEMITSLAGDCPPCISHTPLPCPPPDTID
ncbi:MAG TPA: class I lanthipeptide [Candidatus Deferrimicrobium sp.]|nr:class I lanthipeptide [Candidatus Deferrimicrobium sp.]